MSDGLPADPPPLDATSAPAPAPAPGTSLVPSWVRGASNLYAMLATAVAVGLALFLVGWLAPVLGPLGLGLFLAAIAGPLFTWVEARSRSAGLALVVTLAVVVGVVGLLVVLAIGSAQALAGSLATYADAIGERMDEAAASGAAGSTLRSLLPPEVLVQVLRASVDIALEIGSSLAFAIVIAALLLLDARRLARLVAGGLGSGNPVFREAPGLAKVAVTYLVVRIRINAVTAISLLALMLLVGVDQAVLWAIGAFFLSFVPYLGLVLALVPPTILAFAESGPGAAAVIVIGGVVLNLVAENVLEPTLTGRALSLTTWVVFAMFFFWAWLIGPVGMLLAMPITVLLVLVLEHNERTRWVAALLTRHGEETAPDAAAGDAGAVPRPGAEPS